MEPTTEIPLSMGLFPSAKLFHQTRLLIWRITARNKSTHSFRDFVFMALPRLVLYHRAKLKCKDDCASVSIIAREICRSWVKLNVCFMWRRLFPSACCTCGCRPLIPGGTSAPEPIKDDITELSVLHYQLCLLDNLCGFFFFFVFLYAHCIESVGMQTSVLFLLLVPQFCKIAHCSSLGAVFHTQQFQQQAEIKLQN